LVPPLSFVTTFLTVSVPACWLLLKVQVTDSSEAMLMEDSVVPLRVPEPSLHVAESSCQPAGAVSATE
jgi:hypothetical protein